MEFGQEAEEFMARYALRKDAIAYAATNAAVVGEKDEYGYQELFGHDPDGRRYRIILRRGEVIVLVRPVPDDDS